MKRFNWTMAFSRNIGKTNGLLLLISFYILISPFSGELKYYSALLSNLNANWNGIAEINSIFHPIQFSLSVTLLQLAYLVEFLFPKYWGFENLFFIRFLLKLPSLILFIVSAFVLSKIFMVYYKNKTIENESFYLQLFNLPILYSVIVQGTNEVFPITFFFISMAYVLLYVESGNYKKNLIISGIMSGLTITFSFIYFIYVAVLYVKLKNFDKLLHGLTAIGTFVFIYFTWGYMIIQENILFNKIITGFELFYRFLQNLDLMLLIIFVSHILILIYLFATEKKIDLILLYLLSMMLTITFIYNFDEYLFTLNMFIVSLYAFIFHKSEFVSYGKYLKILIIGFLFILLLLYQMYLYPLKEVIYLDLIKSGSLATLINNIEIIPIRIVLFIIITSFLAILNIFILFGILKKLFIKLKVYDSLNSNRVIKFK